MTGRAPAVHRAMGVVDTVAGRPGATRAEIAAELGLARSSVIDLVAALEIEGLLAPDDADGWRLGGRFSGLVELPLGGQGLLDRFARVCPRVTDLDGQTISVDRPFGVQSVCLDVRMGRWPLRLTPRPGQLTPLAESAGGLAVLRGMTPEQAGERIAGFAGHQGFATDDVAELLELRRSLPPAGQVIDRTGRQGAQQLAAPIPGSTGAPVAAVVLHVPAGPDDPASRRRWARALAKLAADLGDIPAG